jgi:hypothetical protein
VHFKYLNLVAAPERIDSRAETGDAAADDHDFAVIGIHGLVSLRYAGSGLESGGGVTDSSQMREKENGTGINPLRAQAHDARRA